jgi:hypothetical protein
MRLRFRDIGGHDYSRRILGGGDRRSRKTACGVAGPVLFRKLKEGSRQRTAWLRGTHAFTSRATWGTRFGEGNNWIGVWDKMDRKVGTIQIGQKEVVARGVGRADQSDHRWDNLNR